MSYYQTCLYTDRQTYRKTYIYRENLKLVSLHNIDRKSKHTTLHCQKQVFSTSFYMNVNAVRTGNMTSLFSRYNFITVSEVEQMRQIFCKGCMKDTNQIHISDKYFLCHHNHFVMSAINSINFILI